MNERFDFSPAYLRRMLWKMMIEVDRFYDQEFTPNMFKRGQRPIPWPTHIKLSSLLSTFVDGDKMNSRTFPEEWSAEFYRNKGLLRNSGGKGWHVLNRRRLPKSSWRGGAERRYQLLPRRRHQLLPRRIQAPSISPRRRRK